MSALLPLLADAATPERGIAVLASTIGSDFTPEALAEFVQKGKFSPVVVDWAWITYHWDRTELAAVNRFLDLMASAKVPVAAMYRPRFLSNPTVPTQIGQDGRPGTDHAEICYSEPSARKWGLSWGEKILEKCPAFREIIIYNPLDNCQCARCKASREKGRYAATVGFLSEARSAWRAKQPGVKLGTVYMPVSDFWEAALPTVDVAHPYLRIRTDVDPAGDVQSIKAVRSIAKEKMGSCLGKITWEEGAKVTTDKLKLIDDLARRDGISYFYWTFDTLFASPLYDQRAVAGVLGFDPQIVKLVGGKLQPAGTSASPPAPAPVVETVTSTPTADGKYTPEQVRDASIEALIARVANPLPGYHQFSALWAIPEKAKAADEGGRRSIISKVMQVVNDPKAPHDQRWQCIYALADIGDESVVPDLTKILQQKSRLSLFAAEGLATLVKSTNNTDAREALLKAAPGDPAVSEVVSRQLGVTVPAAAPVASTPPAAAGSAVEELAPSGAPQPPPGPSRPVAKPLPWPFPGSQEDQHIFNNYQQATDIYIHSGLDFILPAGTPVKAVGPGYVAAIYTNYPDWTTHYFFIVTPKKGGDRGWCYTHLDPRTFTFKVGDSISEGQTLGSLVDFSVGGKPGVAHLHLHYVSFTRDASGKVEVHSVLDPLYFFDWKDSQPPTFQPLRFISEGATRQFDADAAGVVTVSGKVDILAAIADGAFPNHMGNLGVPVVMLSISDGKHTMQKLVLDHRGDVGNERQTRPLYLSYEEKKAFLNPDSFPRYQVLHVTKTDGDGRITSKDASQCWDTTALDSGGRPLWPDGEYCVNVYAWDIGSNRAAVGAKVRVSNNHR